MLCFVTISKVWKPSCSPYLRRAIDDAMERKNMNPSLLEELEK